jgi:hypothetical protein
MTICTHTHTFSDVSSCWPTPCPPLCFIQSLLYNPPSCLLTWRSLFFALGANTHPLLSLVGYQLFSPCCLTHPKGTPHIMLHIYIDDINISRPVWYRCCIWSEVFNWFTFTKGSFYVICKPILMCHNGSRLYWTAGCVVISM